MKFDDKVWKLLKRIPRGKVTTYKLIAQVLNSRAYRAVGNACHRNPYPVTVPCHRVVCSDGSLGGYGGGLRKKALLLRKEGIAVRNNTIPSLARVLFELPPKSPLSRGVRGVSLTGSR